MSEQVWYYSQHGERKGPVTLEVLQNALAHGKIDIATDLVWGPGLPEWVKVHEVPELQGMTAAPDAESPTPPPVGTPTPAADSSMSNIVPPSQVKAARAAENPYASPDSDDALQEAMAARKGGEYPGMGRLMYWFVPSIVCSVIVLIAGFVAGGDGDTISTQQQIVYGIALIVCLFIGVFSTFSRLVNLGMSRWAILWNIVPIMNIWLQYRLYVCPIGYNDHKKLDVPGKILIFFYIGLFIVPVVLLLIGGAFFGEVVDDQVHKIEGQELRHEASE